MARTVALHIGPPKTGTTFLQSVLWANKALLRERGLLLPLRGLLQHYWACQVVRGELPDDAGDRQRSAWDRLLAATDEAPDGVLISHEVFALADRDRAGAALGRLRQVADAVRLIVTCRDLARQLPSHWTQRLKQGESYTFTRFVETADDDDGGNYFGRNQDLRRVLDRWQHDLPDADVHLVTLPPRGAGPATLLARFGEAVGQDLTCLDLSAARTNPSLGRAEAELLRRSNAALPRDRLTNRQQVQLRQILGDDILAQHRGEPLVLSPTHLAWARERSLLVDAFLRNHDYPVHGDLADLVVPDTGDPQGPYIDDPVPDADLARVAADCLQPAVLAALAADPPR